MAKILCVEDEANIQKAIGIILESNGFEVDFASDGLQALQKIGEFKPDLLLLDMFMPNLSGKTVCERVRANPKYKHLKIILLTVALLSEVGKAELSKLGISAYITKPFDNDDLLRKVKKTLGTR